MSGKKKLRLLQKYAKKFNHDPEKFEQFRKDYLTELHESEKSDAFVDLIKTHLKRGNVTLLYSAKDKENNQVTVLLEFLASKGVSEAKAID